MSAEMPTTIQRRFLVYNGDGLEVAVLMLKNLLLTIVTLFIYRAWAKTNVRRYVWGHTSFEGDRGQYVGTGIELFKGWINLIFLLGGLIIAAKLLTMIHPAFAVLIPLVYIGIIGLAIYSGLRYRLSRTLWRQIRFGIDKNDLATREFLIGFYWRAFLTLITLGIYSPFFRIWQRRFLINKMRFGNAYLRFDGDASAYAKICYINLFFVVITLGIYIPWMLRNLTAYSLEHTHFQNAKFGFTLKGSELLVYSLVAYFGTIFSIGVAFPWIYNWGLKLFTNHIYVDGVIDTSMIQARESDGSAMADDLASSYDLDLGF